MEIPDTLATTNARKVGEWNAILAKLDAEMRVHAMSLRVGFLEIQKFDPIPVAITKALDAAKRLGRPILIEDVGFSINALGGFPGAMYGPIEEKIGRRGILDILDRYNRRDATASMTIAFFGGNGLVYVVHSRVTGTIPREERGENGFGFDSIFIPRDEDKTYAEMSQDEKNKNSMRRKAIEMLLQEKWTAYDPAEASPLFPYL